MDHFRRALHWRSRFPGLARTLGDRPAVFFDGPAGSQTPDRVIAAVARYLAETNANRGGVFATSRESDRLLEQAQSALADFLGVREPTGVAFGANMTTLTFSLSRALARTWRPGDEVIVTRLDHDANVTPWVLAAADAGATVRKIGILPDCTLDLAQLDAALSARTRLVALGAASNAVGTINPVAEVTAKAHRVGAHVFVDAVHSAPHLPVNGEGWGCDFVVCSAYKFFGPHVGILWGRAELMGALPAYKVRPAPDRAPDRWMTGTQDHEGIAGALAAIEYLEDIGRSQARSDNCPDRQARLSAAYAAIREWEDALVVRLLAGLAELRSVNVLGITDRSRLGERVPTVSFTHARRRPREVAEYLAERGIFVWHGNMYAIELCEALGLEEGMVRVGLLHYNTPDEVDRLLAALAELER